MRAGSAEFITLREACGLTQVGAAELIGCSHRAVQHWEGGERTVPLKRITVLRNLDDLIRDRATGVIQPLVPKKGRPDRVELIRYRTTESYAAGQPGHAEAGLPMASYNAMLARVMDGLSRLGIRYAVRWSDQVEPQSSPYAEGEFNVEDAELDDVSA
jgi:DNA-binding XRE family transcriptional regulator